MNPLFNFVGRLFFLCRSIFNLFVLLNTSWLSQALFLLRLYNPSQWLSSQLVWPPNSFIHSLLYFFIFPLTLISFLVFHEAVVFFSFDSFPFVAYAYHRYLPRGFIRIKFSLGGFCFKGNLFIITNVFANFVANFNIYLEIRLIMSLLINFSKRNFNMDFFYTKNNDNFICIGRGVIEIQNEHCWCNLKLGDKDFFVQWTIFEMSEFK